MEELEDIDEQEMNYLDKTIIFMTVFLKYLTVYGLPKIYLCIYLGFLMFLFIIDIFNKKIYKNEYKKILLLGIIACYFICLYIEHNFLISVLLAVICLRRTDNEFIKIFFVSSIICFAFTLILYGAGILTPNNIIKKYNNFISYRYSLGFNHPNEVFLFFLPIVLSGFYLFSNKKTFYIFTIAISVVLYKLTYCRTGFYIIIIFLIFVLFRKIFTKKLIKKIIPIMFVLLTVISILLAVFFGNDVNNIMSKLLSKRPNFWNYYVENGTLISLFGNNKVEGEFLDNFYIYLLVQLGIIGYLIYFIIYYRSIKKMKFNYKYLIIVMTFLIYGLFEANVIIGSIQFLLAIQLKRIIEGEK